MVSSFLRPLPGGVDIWVDAAARSRLQEEAVEFARVGDGVRIE